MISSLYHVYIISCFRSNPHLRIALPVQNREDSGQATASQSSWLSLEENELEAIKLAAELQGDVCTSSKAIHTLCALRVKAVMNHRKSLFDQSIMRTSNNLLDVKLKTFPIGFSTRNYCIVGSFDNDEN